MHLLALSEIITTQCAQENLEVRLDPRYPGDLHRDKAALPEQQVQNADKYQDCPREGRGFLQYGLLGRTQGTW